MIQIEDGMLVLENWMGEAESIVSAAGAENASMIPLKIETLNRPQKDLVANRDHQRAQDVIVHAQDLHDTNHHHRHHHTDDVIVVNSFSLHLLC